MRWVTRLYKPPLFLISSLIIQAAAEPHTNSFSPAWVLAQLFQKYSRPVKKSDFLVSNQGSSSIKITRGPFTLESSVCSSEKALSQFFGVLNSFSKVLLSARVKLSNRVWVVLLASPVV